MTMHYTKRNALRRATPLTRVMSVATLALAVLMSTSFASREAWATDAAGSAQQVSRTGGQSLRLALEKSAILRLPANAKDVIVGNTDLVDVVLKNRNTAYLFARKTGQTNIFFLGANGQQLLQLDLEVTLDTKPLRTLIDRSLPGSSIQLDSTGSNVVLKGTVKDAQQGKTAEDLTKQFLSAFGGGDVVNLLTIAEGNQVTLKVRVIELKRTIVKRLGIDLDGTIKAGPFNFKFNNASFQDNTDVVGKGDLIFPGPPVSLDATIRALEDNGLATILAEPTLTSISGAPATFHAGGEYPYNSCSTPSETVLYSCNTSYKPYGIRLNFTPTVLSEGRIALNIYTEVSELGVALSTDGAPPIDTRNAQTSLELPSGGSMVLAGLIRNTTQQNMRNTPGLRSLPILGGLFSNQLMKQNDTELVVIVTPFIVGPTEESKLATPIDNFNPATDLQQLFLGRMNKVYGPPGAEGVGGTYNGKVGHIIE